MMLEKCEIEWVWKLKTCPFVPGLSHQKLNCLGKHEVIIDADRKVFVDDCAENIVFGQ